MPVAITSKPRTHPFAPSANSGQALSSSKRASDTQASLKPLRSSPIYAVPNDIGNAGWVRRDESFRVTQATVRVPQRDQSSLGRIRMTQIVRRHLICLSPSGRPCAANFIPTTHAVHRRKVGPTASNSALQPRSKARSRVLLRVCQPPRIIRNGTCRCKPASASRTNSAALEVSWQRAARDQRPPTTRT